MSKPHVRNEHDQAVGRATELRDLLLHHAHRYYVLDDPSITDADYDALFRELQAIAVPLLERFVMRHYDPRVVESLGDQSQPLTLFIDRVTLKKSR